jgi:DNA polymerase-3 subunit delta'
VFEDLEGQPEATRLLRAALAERPAHAYLFHGAPGVGKWKAALAFAGALLGDAERTARLAHPDLYALSPLGDQIRIDAVRELRRDLHMRPFEAARRVYVVRSAHLLNPDAADALLKDLEEPPEYAVIVLVADELGPLPETIRSRCQLVPFRRLSERVVREWLERHAVGLEPEQLAALARVAGGRLDRAERLMHEEGAERRATLLRVARSVYADDGFDPGEAASSLLELAHRSSASARRELEADLADLQLPARELEQRLRRAAFGAEREDVLEALEELGAWYRDLIATAVGAGEAAFNCDRLAELAADASVARLAAAERATEIVREAWRSYQELNLHPALALEALFVRLRREWAAAPAALA